MKWVILVLYAAHKVWWSRQHRVRVVRVMPFPGGERKW